MNSIFMLLLIRLFIPVNAKGGRVIAAAVILFVPPGIDDDDDATT